MLMASHVWLALQSKLRPYDESSLAEFLAGALAPDVRYLQPELTRESTHSPQAAAGLSGPFGAGYQHHLAVDQVFYRRCRSGLAGSLGPLNCSLLLELYAVRQLPPGLILKPPPNLKPYLQLGVSEPAARSFFDGCAAYIRDRNPDAAVLMLTGSLRERAANYLARWNRWQGALKTGARVSAPWLRRFLLQVGRDAETAVGNEVA